MEKIRCAKSAKLLAQWIISSFLNMKLARTLTKVGEYPLKTNPKQFYYATASEQSICVNMPNGGGKILFFN